MKKSKSLSHRLREVILNGTWIANTNYKDQLQNLDWKTAIYKIDGLNTIADLTQHIHYYIKGVKNVFENGKLEIRDKYSFDFPHIKSNKEWQEIISLFWTDTESLARLIEQVSNDTLDQDFVDIKYGSYQRNIDAMIEHSYYHLGQIVLIKKLILSKSPL